jgi:hypothetical protein
VTIDHARFDGTAFPDTNGIDATITPRADGGARVVATWPAREDAAARRYALRHALIHRVAQSHPDVLFVAAYLDDGVAIRRAMVAARLPLVANIGTSSSYCMPAFGNRLGAQAVVRLTSSTVSTSTSPA